MITISKFTSILIYTYISIFKSITFNLSKLLSNFFITTFIVIFKFSLHYQIYCQSVYYLSSKYCGEYFLLTRVQNQFIHYQLTNQLLDIQFPLLFTQLLHTFLHTITTSQYHKNKKKLMRKAQSMGKAMQKGKSMSSIHQNHQSRITNKSIDTRKVDSKVSRVSKTNSTIKVHQPLTIDQRQTVKQSRLQSSKPQQHQQLITQDPSAKSRQKIHSHLQNKNSYQTNAISFRPSQQHCRTVNIQSSSSNQDVNSNHTQKTSITNTNQNQLKLKQQNDKLIRENRQLRDRVFRLQESSIQDKDKIKTLITRISEIKRDSRVCENSGVGVMSKSKTTASYAAIIKTRGLTQRENLQTSNFRNQIEETPFRILQHQPSASQSKYSRTKQTCTNPQCEEKKRYLQGELYKERIKRDHLEEEKKDWQRNKDQLKRQYQDLLFEIQNLRQQQSACEQQQ